MSLSIVTDLADVPLFASHPAKTALIDCSDAGELGYPLGLGPQELTKQPLTLYEILMVNISGGEGLFHIWQEEIKVEKILLAEKNLLLIPGCPLRTDQLNEYMTHEHAYGKDDIYQRLATFVRWLRDERGYQEIIFLAGRVPTRLRQAVDNACEKNNK